MSFDENFFRQEKCGGLATATLGLTNEPL